jgi:enoyl-CoA hydratase
MSAQLEVAVEGRLGVIALNRPEAINALSAEMIAGISETLARWRGDDAVRAVLFEGRGERGFCSGGDVRAVRAMIVEGRPDEAEAYFAAEYAMNLAIASYERPVIAIADGVIMGGGIGIAGHARFRFTTPDAKFAMPEAGIGFFSDVGVNAILSKAPLQRALLFLMGGTPVGATDALALGLTDCAVAPDKLAELRAGLVAAANAASLESAIVGLMQAHSIQAGERALCPLADLLEDEFYQDSAAAIVAEIKEAAEEISEAKPIAALLETRSPTSLEAILQSHLAARKLPDTRSVLALDLRLARLMAGLPDFAEGVRAVLVDKDRAPRWSPADFAGVPVAAIRDAVAGVEAAATASV